jgi:hypothetical protein
MAGFPQTAPALTITVNIAVPYLVGSISRGTPLTVVPIIGGTVASEPGFEPSVEAKFKGTGNDYMHTDPTGEHMRLDSHVVVEWVMFLSSLRGFLVLTTFGRVQDNRWRGGFISHGDTWSNPTDKNDQLIYMKYYGIIDITPGLAAILSGRPDAKSTDFGNAC